MISRAHNNTSCTTHAIATIYICQSGTSVNDLLSTICCRAVRKYLQLEKDELFASIGDGNKNALKKYRFGNSLSGTMAVNIRETDETSLSAALDLYSKTGSNCNEIVSVPLRYPIDNNVSINTIQDIVKPYKYGCMEFFLALHNSAKYKTKEFLPQHLKDSSPYADYTAALNISNYIAPTQPLPIPAGDNNDDSDENDENQTKLKTNMNEKNEEENFVTRYYDGIVIDKLPMVFAPVTYHDLCKVGIVTNNDFIQKPNLLKLCWMNEWQKLEQATP